jgi:uncharacterized metal-binding protein YceD (DUF177 family)
MSDFPIAQPYELGRLGQADDVIVIAPGDEERARIAQWAGIDALDSFRAKIGLRKVTPTRFSLDVALAADIVQSCVVTLEPVKSHVESSFTRDLFLTQTKSLDIDVAPVDEDGREEIASPHYDLAVPVLEELALLIDPYPRCPGVKFEPPAGGADEDAHPFAALKKLK